MFDNTISMRTILCVCFVLISLFDVDAANSQDSTAAKLDQYIDARFDGTQEQTSKILSDLQKSFSSTTEICKALEKQIRQRRASYPERVSWMGKITTHEVDCLHVDYSSQFFMYVPENLDDSKSIGLVVVGHGGNSSMSKQRASSVAKMYLRVYHKGITKHLQAVVIAPVSERGWGQIGNSLILSSISKVQRMLPIDPDRIYVTGQSMGGHLAYRSALTLPDRWGAVSPHSGGYDFVAKKSIRNLSNVPGYSIWGVREPYGINKDNRTNNKWAKANSLNWKFVEKNGGHTIYQDELPKVSKFFAENPRNLYPKQVYFRAGGEMKFTKTWNVKSWPKHTVDHERKPLRWNLRHWLEVTPRPDTKEPLSVLAKNLGDNRFEVLSENVRELSLLLHPKMVNFDKPVKVVVNGETLFEDRVSPNPELMLELAREFDDRGRVYWARVSLKIKSDKPVATD